jgi:zinc transporter
MNDSAPVETSRVPPESDNRNGLVFAYDFAQDGACAATGDPVAWSWRSYSLTDNRARRSIELESGLSEAARASLLSGPEHCHIDYDEGWLHGELPDLRHEHYSAAREIGHLRFAVNETALISGRRQPLRSVEAVRSAVERGKRYRSPFDLVEAVMSQTLTQLDGEIRKLGDQLDTIEDRIVGDSWHGEREALTAARRDAVLVHRQVATVTTLFRHLDHAHQDDLPPAAAGMAARLSNRAIGLHQDCEQIQARARLLQDELLAKLTAQSNRLLYFLSVLTAVLMPMTIISGLFGMNVEGIPFAEGPAGFWVVSAIAVAVAIAVLFGVSRLGRTR